MGVYISGMEMPNENEQAVVVILFSDGHAEKMDHTHFGVISVQKHGRLIDADALMQSFHDEYDDEEVHAFEKGAYWFHGDVVDLVNESHTIIPPEQQQEDEPDA